MPRVAFYSHDTMGLGHVRRNLLVAGALTSSDPAMTALLVSGVHVGAAFPMPPNVDCVTLPAVAKQEQDGGAYGARHLAVPLTRMRRLRTRITRAALLAFDPDLVVVDNVPRGAMGEAEPALAALKARGRARFVLGLRDVLDEPERVAKEWRRSGHHEAIAQYYDQVWVYGDPGIYDVARECGFPLSTRRRIEYVGYLDRRSSAPPADAGAIAALPRVFALCMTGGGQDGSALALAFARARSQACARVVVGGPFLPEPARRELRDLARVDQSLQILDFVADTSPLLEKASRVVIMGGYNTVCEALAYEKPALIVPREWPRREQAIRAERLARLGLADVLPSAQVSAEAVRRWLESPLALRPAIAMDFGALARVPELAARLLGAAARPMRSLETGGRLRAS